MAHKLRIKAATLTAKAFPSGECQRFLDYKVHLITNPNNKSNGENTSKNADLHDDSNHHASNFRSLI